VDRLSRDRNGTAVFASRTQKNLDYIVDSSAKGADVHPITQSVAALLGIVVFPWETNALERVQNQRLPVLTAAGWPRWNATGTRRVATLGDLVFVLRNAVSHGNVEFDADERNPSAVSIRFTHFPRDQKTPDWVCDIRGGELIDFCRRFVRAMEEAVK
jgi:hypothetical protein